MKAGARESKNALGFTPLQLAESRRTLEMANHGSRGRVSPVKHGSDGWDLEICEVNIPRVLKNPQNIGT